MTTYIDDVVCLPTGHPKRSRVARDVAIRILTGYAASASRDAVTVLRPMAANDRLNERNLVVEACSMLKGMNEDNPVQDYDFMNPHEAAERLRWKRRVQECLNGREYAG